MKIQGSYTFEAPREVVWNLLMDPQVIAQVLPGVDHFTPVGPDEYSAALKIGIGSISGVYKGHVHLDELKPPESYRLHVKGQGARGIVQGTGQIELYDGEPGTTLMHYEGDATVGGQIASVGQRLLDSAARSLISQGLKAMEMQIAERHHEPIVVPDALEAPADTLGVLVPAESALPAPPAIGSSELPLHPPSSTGAADTESSRFPPRPAPPVIREPVDPLVLYGGWLTAALMFLLLLVVLLRRKA